MRNIIHRQAIVFCFGINFFGHYIITLELNFIGYT